MDTQAQLLAQDQRIDDLIMQAEETVAALSDVAARMKLILSAAAAHVDEQKQISAEGRDSGR
jgi:hypothetical protein